MLCAAIDDSVRTRAERLDGGATAPAAELLQLYARDYLREGARPAVVERVRSGAPRDDRPVRKAR